MKKNLLSLGKIASLSLFLGLAIASCKKEEAPIIQPPDGGDMITVNEVNETFDGTKYDDVEIDGWNNIVVTGDQPYILNEFSDNTYANMSVYKAEGARESWLITPMLNVKDATFKYISFDTRADHLEGATLEVLSSTDFDGANRETATWNKLNVTLSTATADGYGKWVNSGKVDLSENCAIAFKYVGHAETAKGGFSIDNFTFNKEIEDPEVGTGSGTLSDPYDIVNAQANQGVEDNKDYKWTKGYIVGYIETSDDSADKGKFIAGTSDHVNTNLVIANSKDETDIAKALIVQLPFGFVRDALNLVDNKDKLGTQIWLKGSLEAYFGAPGIKSITSFSYDGTKEETAPDTGIDGEGTPIDGSDLTATTINFTVWNALKSEAIWTAKDGKASINAYGKGETESWMISKTMLDFDAVTDARLFVSESINYFSSFDDVQVMISTDYSGSGDPSSASWSALNVDGTRAQNGDVVTQFVATGKGYIAFKYSASATKASSWTIKTVEVKAKEDNGGSNPPAATGLVNGGFEKWTSDTAPEGWTKAENATKESTIVHGGSFSVKHVGGTKDIAQKFSAEENATYEIKFWYYVESGDGTDARLWSYFKDASGASIGSALTGDDDYLPGATGEWHEFSKEYVSPAGTTDIYFELRTYGSAIVYYDDITVTKK